MTASGSTVQGYAVDHIGISVSDLPSAVDFCTRHLAATVLFSLDPPAPGEPTGADRLGAPAEAGFSLAMLQLGNRRVELLQWSPDDVAAEAIAHAGSHVAIEVADVAGTVETLRADPRSVVLGEPVTFHEGPTPGLTNAFVRTGAGLLLELVHWGPPVGAGETAGAGVGA